MSKKINLSPSQCQARDKTGENIIVSAAAGSGKTAVLSKRVRRYVKEGGDIDKLLIVTFTKAAATEMRSRIGRELEEEYKQSPSKSLKKQILKVYSAQICTIDSYLGKLVKEHFEELGTSPTYTMLDNIEAEALINSILEDILEDEYIQMSPEFATLSELLGGEGENEKLNNCILKIYHALGSTPFPQQWMTYVLTLFDSPEIWVEQACKETNIVLNDLISIYDNIYISKIFNQGKSAEKFSQEYLLLKNIQTACNHNNWDDLCIFIQDFITLTAITVRKPCSLLHAQYRQARKLMKDFLSKEIFIYRQQDIKEQLSSLKSPVTALFNIVQKLFINSVQQMKQQNAYTFNTISQMALHLLVDHYDYNTRNYTRTLTAQQLRDDYAEIMIDECQDVNDLQNLLFDSISNQNLFIVGDSKQCIYAFRGSNPENFTNKKSAFYPITLNTNYRSRDGILKFSNFIFERLFSQPIGGTDYKEDEKLNYSGLYPIDEQPTVEIHLYQTENLKNEKENTTQELYQITTRVQEILQTENVVGKNGTQRPIQPSDIAILVRNNTEAEAVERMLTNANIPAYAKNGGSFLTSIDVSTVLTFLRVLDNPHDDLSLFKTLTGRLFDLDENIIVQAKLVCTNKRASLYQAISNYPHEDLQMFVDTICKFRIFIQNMPLHDVLSQIFELNGYLNRIAALPAGGFRRENLQMLYDFVLKYEQNSSNSLHRFLNFVSRSINRVKDTEGAAPQGEFIKIMTMHASKGLEFPVCILPFLEKNLRQKRTDDAADVNIDISLGIGAIMKDQDELYKYRSFMYDLIKLRTDRLQVSENLRLLYVAMTRAREKLLLFSVVSKKEIDDSFEADFAMAYQVKREEGSFYSKVLPAAVLSASNFFDYICRAFTHHPYAGVLSGPYPADSENTPEVWVHLTQETKGIKQTTETEPIPLEVNTNELQRRFAYTYPGMSHIPAKISVTELAKGFTGDEDSLPLIPPDKSTPEPVFLNKRQNSGVNRGTAIHKFMAAADLTKSAQEELIRLQNNNILTKEQADIIPLYEINQYQKSELFQTTLKAERVIKEDSFIIRIPATMYDKHAPNKDAEILLQGAIDALYEYKDGFILIDYKSDRKLNAAELIQRYKQQLSYYKLAVEKIFEKPVLKTYIWSFSLGTAIELDIPNNSC